MPIHTGCAHCGQEYYVREQLAGKEIPCTCGHRLLVPETSCEAASPQTQPGDSDPTQFRADRRRWRSLLVFGFVAVLIVGFGIALSRIPASRVALPQGFDSPKEAFDALTTAVARGDWAAALRTFTPDSQDTIVGFAALGAVETSRSNPQVAELLLRHGIDIAREQASLASLFGGRIDFSQVLNPAALLEPERMLSSKLFPQVQAVLLLQRFRDLKLRARLLADQIRDKPGFYDELMRQFGTRHDLERKLGLPIPDGLKPLLDSRLTDVQIANDTATGWRATNFSGTSIRVPVFFRRIESRWYNTLPASVGEAAGAVLKGLGR